MSWLTPTDRALVGLAMRVAEEIEGAADRAEVLHDLKGEFASDQDVYKKLQRLEALCDVTRSVRDLGPQLQSLLKDLGGTPGARAALKLDKPVKGRLADLRASAAAREHDP